MIRVSSRNSIFIRRNTLHLSAFLTAGAMYVDGFNKIFKGLAGISERGCHREFIFSIVVAAQYSFLQGVYLMIVAYILYMVDQKGAMPRK